MKDFLVEFYNNSSGIDLFFFLITIIFAIKSSIKGFVVSLLSASKWVVSYVLTIILFPKIKPFVENFSKNEYVLDLVLGVSLFIPSSVGLEIPKFKLFIKFHTSDPNMIF